MRKLIIACFSERVKSLLLNPGHTIVLLFVFSISVNPAMGLTVSDEAEHGAGEEVLSRLESGRAIYNFRCYYCHGYSGDAQTLASTYLNPRPRNFTAPDAKRLNRERMIDAVTNGRPGTAMKGFRNTLSESDISLVVDFVRWEFIRSGRRNTRYHTLENGWDRHDRYLIAYPFATGELALDTPWEELNQEQRRGKRLFLSSCISCHDRARVEDEGKIWDAHAVSYPRIDFSPGDFLLPPDAVSGASAFARHDVAPAVDGLDPIEREGEALFQGNCAFCHGADGSGKNWIGVFLEPHARDLRSDEVMGNMTRERLRKTIAEGIVGTSMPAWRGVLNPGQIEAVIAYIDKVIHKLADNQPEAPEAGL
jgi:cytochrome c oxidase cbb3-type subunit 3